MSRFKEGNRIEEAIKNQDERQLLWAVDYCKMRIKTANQIGLSATKVKLHTKHWQDILDRVEDALSECKKKT
jgi:hypothetical protein